MGKPISIRHMWEDVYEFKVILLFLEKHVSTGEDRFHPSPLQGYQYHTQRPSDSVIGRDSKTFRSFH